MIVLFDERNKNKNNNSSNNNNNNKNINKKDNSNTTIPCTTDTTTSSMDGGTETTPISIASESHPLQQQVPPLPASSSSLLDDENPLYSHRTCPICMEPYESGDMICWSRNENCSHAFHLECKVNYLLNTDECILCRNDFLNHQGCLMEDVFVQ
jgi:hypothetical protein